MEERGIITGATIHVNYKSFGYKAVAHILINVDPRQADKLVKQLQQTPEVYSVYNREVKGNIDVVVILKALEQLNEVKDLIKRSFSILEMKTAIWTDVKEMNENLAIIPLNFKEVSEDSHAATMEKEVKTQTGTTDEIDKKIANKLAENGRISMERLSKEIGISVATSKRRYERLKKNGVLKVTIQINLKRIGYQAICIFFISTLGETSHLIIDKLCMLPNIISIMKTSGDYDLEVYAIVQNIDQLLYVQEEIGKIPGINKIESEISRIGEMWMKWPSPRQYISTF